MQTIQTEMTSVTKKIMNLKTPEKMTMMKTEMNTRDSNNIFIR